MSLEQSCAERVAEVGHSLTVTESVEEGAETAGLFVPGVLFVDDEHHVLEGLRRAFLNYPYRVATAASPQIALQMLRREQFDVIVADELMPEMRGSELLTVIAREFPATGRILLTGHATIAAAARAINEAGVIRFLLKPCKPEELRDAIETALRITPFEKRARTGRTRSRRKRVYVVSQTDPVARRARGAGRGAAARAPRHSAVEGPDAGGESDELTGTRAEWDASELLLQAQRVLFLAQETLFGYELSARLRAQGGHVHTVGNFVGSVDHAARLPAVDRLVVSHALNALRDYAHLLERRDLTVSLNIGVQSLADPDFAHFLDGELSAASITSRFMIEVRESALAKRLRTDSGLLARLAEMKCFKGGCRLCIDGVGGELEALPSLSALPVAVAKIDSRYIGDILTNRDSESRVRSVVNWGQRTGVDVAATGIDTVAISERLRTLGVRYGQGSAFGGPELLNLVLG
jgi:two-component system, probable response regulator PhcQ